MPRPGKINFGLLLSLVLNVALAAGVGWLLFGPKPTPGGGGGSGGGVSTPEPASAGEVSALGRVQPTGGLIAVFGPPGDRIEKFEKFNGPVRAATKLATLSGEGERQAQVDALAAQVKEAEALKVSVEASKKAKLEDIDAEARQAEVAADEDAKALDAKLKAVDAKKAQAEGLRDRLKSVRAAAVQIEEAEAAVAVAVAEREATVAQKEKLKAVKAEGKNSLVAKKATVDAETKRALAQVPLESLKAGLKAATEKLKSGGITAPVPGSVVRVLSKEGDTVTTMPVLQMADTGRMSVIAEVYESDVGKVREWFAARKTVKAVIDLRVQKETLTGTVPDASRIATVVAKNVLTPLGPREDADRRVVEIEVELDAASAVAAKDYIGLQVRVTLSASR